MVQLSQRDADVLAYLGEVGQAPLDVVAKRFFAFDPRTGKANKDPLHAAARRVGVLKTAGYLNQVLMSASSRKEPAGAILMLDRAGSGLLGIKPKKVHAKHRHHHFQTLRLVEEVRSELLGQGQRVLRVVLEDELRAEILSRRERAYLSREMKAGAVNLNAERYAMPDAVVVVDDGAGGEAFIAVEYLSSTYRDDDLKAKKELLSSERWKSCVVQADNQRTAARAQAVGLNSGILGKAAVG